LGERIEGEEMGRRIAEKTPTKSGEKAEKQKMGLVLFFTPQL
jgi:hypothetical protein